MKHPFLIVVQGGSATGKTFLSKRLAQDLEFHLLSKDNFKEMFYDTLGVPAERSESTLYGLAATKAMYAAAECFLNEGQSLVMESAYNRHFALDDIIDITKKSGALLIQLHLTASPQLRVQRYNARIENGERHTGHPDSVGKMTLESIVADDDKYGPIAISDTFEINTDDFGDAEYDALLLGVKNKIEGGSS